MLSKDPMSLTMGQSKRLRIKRRSLTFHKMMRFQSILGTEKTYQIQTLTIWICHEMILTGTTTTSSKEGAHMLIKDRPKTQIKTFSGLKDYLHIMGTLLHKSIPTTIKWVNWEGGHRIRRKNHKNL